MHGQPQRGVAVWQWWLCVYLGQNEAMAAASSNLDCWSLYKMFNLLRDEAHVCVAMAQGAL
jgi:hypothetical protein